MAVFTNHLVICNWNRRGKTIVSALRALTDQPIVIVTTDVPAVIREVGKIDGVFALSGDPINRKALEAADVAVAQSVVVLALEQLGPSADARSVKIALLVEKIQVTVYTVVELLDIRNKAHFSWTKVDDLITDQELAVRLFAQGVRHVALDAADDESVLSAVQLLDIYRQLVNPHENRAQLFRVAMPWSRSKGLTFDEVLLYGLKVGVLPTAVVGFMRHEIAGRTSDEAWVSWKTDVRPNPPSGTRMDQLWPEWPEGSFELGVIVLARNSAQAERLKGVLS